MTAEPKFRVRLAAGEADLRAAQALRYEVFVAELGGGGEMVDHKTRLEADSFDAEVEHLLLEDLARPGAPVVGVYRLLGAEGATRLGRFYSEGEYDLAPLRQSGRRLLELGRSCLHRDYRGGAAMMHLWQGLARHVAARGIEILFGVASFHGTDPAAVAHALSNLHLRHRAPEALRVRSRAFQPMDLLPEAKLDRRRAVRETPALIKAYLRLGGVVGEGAYIDHAFNTIDVCLVLDTAAMNARHREIYAPGAAA